MQPKWEVGSEFDWCNDGNLTAQPTDLLPKNYQLFSTATAALLALEPILNPAQTNKRLKIHIPTFYCMYVVAKLKQVFDVCWYRDLPNQNYPDFNSLNVVPGDLVIAVNFFGIREAQVWQNWFRQNPDIILIEDHTHDPISDWAKQSNAHYGISSLRKTLPIPDGAIIWSPQNKVLPKTSHLESPGAYKKLTAMLLKRAYLSGVNLDKQQYRQLEIAGREDLDDESQSAVSMFTAIILNFLDINKLRKQRAANIKLFIQKINNSLPDDRLLLFNSWSSGSVPFNPVIILETKILRDKLRKYLIDHQIFPAIHWQQSPEEINSQDPLAINLSNQVLTIPSDGRYSSRDIEQVAEVLINFFN